MTLPHRCPHLVVNGDTELVYPNGTSDIYNAHLKCGFCNTDRLQLTKIRDLALLHQKLSGAAAGKPGVSAFLSSYGRSPGLKRLTIPRAVVTSARLGSSNLQDKKSEPLTFNFSATSEPNPNVEDQARQMGMLFPNLKDYRLELEIPPGIISEDTMNIMFGVDHGMPDIEDLAPKLRPAHRMTVRPMTGMRDNWYIARHISEGYTEETFAAELAAWQNSKSRLANGAQGEESLRRQLNLLTPGYDPQKYEHPRRELAKKLEAAVAAMTPLLDLLPKEKHEPASD